MHPLSRPALLDTSARRHNVRHYRAVIFDMDGVVTDTAHVHAAAWKELFDYALPLVGALPENREVVIADPTRLDPFDLDHDYLNYVDGMPREEGVRSFFASRGLAVPERHEVGEDIITGQIPLVTPGSRSWHPHAEVPDTPETPHNFDDDEEPVDLSVETLAERKQEFFDTVLQRDGVTVFPETLELLEQLRDQDIPLGLVTSSRNSAPVLSAGKVMHFFDHIVDGNTALEHEIPGKPHPDMFLYASRLLDVDPEDTVVLEDAVSGVQAARAGKFGLIVGVDRAESPNRLEEAGADVVVEDISILRLQHRVTRPFDPAWVLAYDEFDPAEEGTREALCTLANGYWGTRGSIPGTHAGGVHYPGSYVAGVFNRLESTVQGREVETEHMVNMPDWTLLSVTPENGQTLLPMNDQLLDYRQEMDLRRGLLTRTQRYQDSEGRITRLVTRQFQSMAGKHVAALQLTVEAENWSGLVDVRSAIDGRVANQNVADDRQLAAHHLEPQEARDIDGHTVLLEMQTSQSQVRVAVAARTQVMWPEDHPEPVRRPVDEGEMVIGHDISLHLQEGVPVTLDKIAAISTSHDQAMSTVSENAMKRVSRAHSFRQLLSYHDEMWGITWRRFAVEIDPPANGTTDHNGYGKYGTGDATAPLDHTKANARHQLALNLHSFHVIQTAFGARQDSDAALGARGLHGEGYRGHIFWDEMFIYPMLTLRRPEITRGLLLYRYRRLNEARANAQAAGYAGAMFPWQSGSDGREETPTELWNPRSHMWMPDNSHNQRHVSLAVAYSVLRYMEATADETFMSDFGAEMLVEVCRFFASLAHYNPGSGRWEIHGVMGPDEYHDGYPDTPGSGLHNNAYTNVLTSWVLQSTVELLRWMDGRDDPLREWLDVFEEELESWVDIATNLKVPFHQDGVISQFDGYEDLLEFDWEGYREKYGNIGRLDLILQAEGDATNRYKLSKQADVLMLPYLFSEQELHETLASMGYELTHEAFVKTVEYYLSRTSHGSTLSRLVHGWVAARTDRSSSWALFSDALEADLSDTQGGTTREGVHLGAMAGTVDMVIRCFAGVETRDNVLRLHPLIPKELPGLRFMVRFHHQPVEVRITHDDVTVTLLESSSTPIALSVEGREKTMSPGETWTVPLLAKAE